MQSYEERIISTYKRYAKRYDKAVGVPTALTEECFCAFMCNAISAAVIKSSRLDLKDAFYHVIMKEGMKLWHATTRNW